MRLNRAVAACLGLTAAVLAGCTMARAEDKPLTLPARDVDVTYEMMGPDGVGGQRALSQRMRWAAQAGKLRVDAPTPGFYMLMDYHEHRLWAVRETQRSVLELDGGSGMAPGLSRAQAFEREGNVQIAGLACTEWRTRDAGGQDAVVCLTADGVLLRARVGVRVMVQAKQVAYGAIPASVFDVPSGYTRLSPPPTEPPVAEPPSATPPPAQPAAPPP